MAGLTSCRTSGVYFHDVFSVIFGYYVSISNLPMEISIQRQIDSLFTRRNTNNNILSLMLILLTHLYDPSLF